MIKYLLIVLLPFILVAPLNASSFVPAQRLVLLSQNNGPEILQEMKSKEVQIKRLKTSQNIFLLDFKNLEINEAQIDEYLIRFNLEVVEKNYIYETSSAPNDLYFPFQWSMNNVGKNSPISNSVAGVDIDLLGSWKMAIGNPSLKISVIDTGIDYNHEDLKDNIWVNESELNGMVGVDDDGNGYVDDIHGYNFVDNNGNPIDKNGHGTHCAGVIGAISNNDIGIVGILKNVKMVPVQFLSESGSGTTANAIQAVAYATKVQSDVISNSWGGGGYSELLKREIEIARDQGIYFVVAAGNNGSNNDVKNVYPADYDVENVITVASHSSSGKLASNSNYGVENVDIAAPGVLIYSTLPENKYGYKSGTSMATPHVSAAIGMLLDFEGRLGFDEMKNRLKETGVPEPSYLGKISSGGRLHLKNFLEDFRTEVERPDELAWNEHYLSEPFESAHPYSDNLSYERKITIPGAKFIIVEIEQMELEDHFDFLKIYSGDGEFIEKLSGDKIGYQSLIIPGESVILKLQSDFAKTKWGVRISKILWQ
jgi:subtilisin family serine protease